MQHSFDGLYLETQRIEIHRNAGKSRRRGNLHGVLAIAFDEFALGTGMEQQSAALFGSEIQGALAEAGDNAVEALLNDAELLSRLLGCGPGHIQALRHIVYTLASCDAQGLVSLESLDDTALGTADCPYEGAGLVGGDPRLAGYGIEGCVGQGQCLSGTQVTGHHGEGVREVSPGPVEKHFVQDDAAVGSPATCPGKLDRGGGGNIQDYR